MSIREIADSWDYTKFLDFSPLFAYSLLTDTSIGQLISKGYNMGVRTFIHSGAKRKRLEDELGFRLPVYTSFSSSDYCNLACDGCYIEKGNSKVISDELLQKTIDNSGELGIHAIMAFGGEPLHPKTRSILFDKIGDNPKYEFIICSNGTYIDDHVADEIASLHNSFVLVSIDGLKELNDRRRGKGTFEKEKNAMRELKERRVFFGASITVTDYNVNEVSSESFIDFLVENGVKFAYYHKFITRDVHSENLPEIDDYSNHLKRLKELAKRKRVMIYDGEYSNMYSKHMMRRSTNNLFVKESGIVTVERAGIPVGDLNKQTLLEIIRTEEVAKIQEFKSQRGPLNNDPRNILDLKDYKKGTFQYDFNRRFY